MKTYIKVNNYYTEVLASNIEGYYEKNNKFGWAIQIGDNEGRFFHIITLEELDDYRTIEELEYKNVIIDNIDIYKHLILSKCGNSPELKELKLNFGAFCSVENILECTFQLEKDNCTMIGYLHLKFLGYKYL